MKFARAAVHSLFRKKLEPTMRNLAGFFIVWGVGEAGVTAYQYMFSPPQLSNADLEKLLSSITRDVMASEEDVDLSTLKSQLSQTQTMWKKDMGRSQSEVDLLQAKIMEVKACIQGYEEDTVKELEVLWRRVKTTATLLTFLKSKARIMAVTHLAHTSCDIKQIDGVGLVDKNGLPLSGSSRNIDLSSFDCPDGETWIGISKQHGSLDEPDGAYIGEVLKNVQMVTDVMETLVKRVIMAESETAMEKEKVTLGQEEIKKKALQIESMSTKLEEMERFALGTNRILNEMRQRVEDLVEETSRQRQRAAENEQELCSVKQDFESLKSYVSSLINVRETLLSSEKQFQTIERLFERGGSMASTSSPIPTSACSLFIPDLYISGIHSPTNFMPSFAGLKSSISTNFGSNRLLTWNECWIWRSSGSREHNKTMLKRLVEKTTQLESEKMQKETEVQKLMEENVRLTTLLDKKEAQLLAMNEQCKVMALSASNI
ncbi:hypothetical protein TEA_012646 [Camellia sinensis var. sinensis]|uniref:Uncharacterized protein n=1 Tax=Camellia sinensis var. sinensis TaxID=542762 RepID=A0A4S4DH13_CAMSN|nr:hypothetical protein TEA_012646 [Camellia sinensis var. sinensis]